MKYTYLGRTGLKVSRLCLGTMNFGNYNDEKESFKIMDAALAAGINFFDTADVYGDGHSEELLGKAMRGRRERFVVATKIGWVGYGGVRPIRQAHGRRPRPTKTAVIDRRYR